MKVCSRLTAFFSLLIISFSSFAQNGIKIDSSKIKKWFPQYDFNAAFFQRPPIQFAPFARWWWPGNDVTKEELKREVNLFADNNFGGVEIQPLSLFIPGSKEQRTRVVSWDTPGYYENVKAVLGEALKSGITVDMTDGSGWPAGGLHLSIEDGFTTLQFAQSDITGNNTIAIALPTVANTTGVPSKLVAVLASKIVAKKLNLKIPIYLL